MLRTVWAALAAESVEQREVVWPAASLMYAAPIVAFSMRRRVGSSFPGRPWHGPPGRGGRDSRSTCHRPRHPLRVTEERSVVEAPLMSSLQLAS